MQNNSFLYLIKLQYLFHDRLLPNFYYLGILKDYSSAIKDEDEIWYNNLASLIHFIELNKIRLKKNSKDAFEFF